MQQKSVPLKTLLLKFILPAVLLLTISLNVLITSYVTGLMVRIISSNTKSASVLLKNTLEKYIQEFDEIYIQAYIFQEMRILLDYYPDRTNVTAFIEKQRKMNDYFSGILLNKPYISNIFIIGKNSEIAVCGSQYPSEKMIKGILDSINKDQKASSSISMSNSAARMLFTDDDLLYIMPIKEKDSKEQDIRFFFIISVNISSLGEKLNYAFALPGQEYILMSNNKIIDFSETGNPKLVKSNLPKGNFVYTEHIGKTGLTLVTYIQDEAIKKDLNNTRLFIFLLSLLFIIVLIFIIYLITSRFTAPLFSLSKSMGTFLDQSTKPEHQIKESNISEIVDINKSYNSMKTRILNLIAENDNKNKLLLRTELSVLQAQINPHFIYHTLNTLSWIAKINRVEKISTLIDSLVRLLKHSIYNPDTRITVSNEIECLKDYIAIENFRHTFPVKLEVCWKEDISCFLTLKLILQPIIENCIQHAFDPDQMDKQIILNCDKTENDIVFEIIDNGKGISTETYRHILDKNLKLNRFSGIGLNNINDRLVLHYGPAYALKIESEEGKGTRIVIRQPMTGGKENNDD